MKCTSCETWSKTQHKFCGKCGFCPKCDRQDAPYTPGLYSDYRIDGIVYSTTFSAPAKGDNRRAGIEFLQDPNDRQNAQDT